MPQFQYTLEPSELTLTQTDNGVLAKETTFHVAVIEKLLTEAMNICSIKWQKYVKTYLNFWSWMVTQQIQEPLITNVNN
jgi:hypothetical protein